MDFFLNKITKLIELLKANNYTFVNTKDYKNNQYKQIILLRHDIDKNPEKALKIANIEHEIGIKGIYYFRIHPSVFNIEIIKSIAKLGHEIGYHYEDLTHAHGNFEKAIVSFEKNLKRFREIVPINSICMDGRPLSKYNNLDLWKQYNYHDFEIDFEPYLDVDFNKVLYLTDTGRGWNLLKYSVRDKVGNPFNYHNKTTFELIEDLKKGSLPDKLMITIHPQRWHNNIFLWFRELILQRIKNILKYILIQIRNQ
jgi:hypothetical protein